MSLDLIFSENVEILIQSLIEDLILFNKNNPFSKIKIIIPNKNLKRYLQLKISSKLGVCSFIDFMYIENYIFEFLRDFFSLNNEKELFNFNNDFVVLNYSENLIFLKLFIFNVIYENIEQEDLKIIKNYVSDKDNFNYLWKIANKLGYYINEFYYHIPDIINLWKSNELFSNFLNIDEIKKEIEKIYKYLINKIKEKFLFDVENIFIENKDENEKNEKEKDKKENDDSEFKYIFLYELFQKLKNNFNDINLINKNFNNKSFNYVIFFGFSQISEFHFDFISFISNIINVKYYSLFYLNFYSLFSNNNISLYDKKESYYLIKLQNDCDIFSHILNNTYDNFINKYFSAFNKNIKVLYKIIKKHNIENNFFLLLKDEIFERYKENLENKKNNFNKFYSEKSNLLNSLKNYILNYRNYLSNKEYDSFLIDNEKIKQDNSIQVFCAPSRKREIETVYNSIIYNLLNDENLSPNDIAILVTDLDSYIYEIKNVFDYYGYLKYNLSDISANFESNFYKAIISFLNLVNSNLGRDEIYGFLMNPLVKKKFKFSDFDVENIFKIIESLDIFYSYNKNDKKINSFFSDSEKFTWSLGLKRVRIGYIYNLLNIDKEFEDNNFNLFHGYFENYFPFINNYLKNPENLERFNLFFEKLFEIIFRARNASTFEEWENIFNELFQNFLYFEDEDRFESELKDSFSNFIRNLKEFKKLNSLEFINCNLIKEIFESEFSKTEIKQGSYLTEGITISKINPMRPIPFKIIYFVGLNEQLFPETKSEDLFDLRTLKENFINKEEIDNYNFIETIILCKEKIYLSYVWKDLEKDSILYPSTCLKDLITFIEKNLIKEKFKIFEIPFFIYDNYEDFLIQKNYINYLKANITDIFYLTLKEDVNLKSYFFDTYQSNQKLRIINKREDEKEIYISDFRDYILNPKKLLIKKIFSLDLREPEEIYESNIEPFYEEDFFYENIQKNIFIELFYFFKENYKNKNLYDYKNFDILNDSFFNNFFNYFLEKLEKGFFSVKLPENFYKTLIYENLEALIKKIYLIFTKLLIEDNIKNLFIKVYKTDNSYKDEISVEDLKLKELNIEGIRKIIIDIVEPNYRDKFYLIKFFDYNLKGLCENVISLSLDNKKIYILYDFFENNTFLKNHIKFFSEYKNFRKFIKIIVDAYFLFKANLNNENLKIVYLCIPKSFTENENSENKKDIFNYNVESGLFLIDKDNLLNYFEVEEKGIIWNMIKNIEESDIYNIDVKELFGLINKYIKKDDHLEEDMLVELLESYKEKVKLKFEDDERYKSEFKIKIDELLCNDCEDRLNIDVLFNRYIKIFDIIKEKYEFFF